MKRTTWKDKWRYRFDNLMSKGAISLIGILFLITALVVIVSGIIVCMLDLEGGINIGKSVWVSLMHAIDAGTLAGDDGNWIFIFIMALVTVCGLFITSMLIGIINAGIEDKMTSLRKGKSLVIENNHIILLGFNENALNILSELITANENQKDEVVVVMDDIDKTEMEDLIHQELPDTKTTRIICRSGKIDRFSDLEICSVETCRSIIINLEQDFITIKSILACVNLLEKSQNTNAYVTAIIRDERNLAAAQIAGGARAEILYFKRTIARLMAHSSRQPGISTVFTNLLSYDGDEIYVEDIAGSEGHTIEELNLRLTNSTIIGIVRSGAPKVNPPADTVLEAGDQVIIIEEDDGVSTLESQAAPVNKSSFAESGELPPQIQHSLILGRSDLLSFVLEELDNYVASGSTVVVADTECDRQVPDQEIPPLKNIRLDMRICDIFSMDSLKGLLMKRPDNVLILTDSTFDDNEADARTLLLLLQIRNIAHQNNLEFTITSEMRNSQNQELAKVTKVNDFVVSSNITALMMTQISQNRHQHAILEDLLDDDGSEFYRKPITRYVKCDKPVDFYTVTSAAARYGEVAVGYQKVQGREFESFLNPNKADMITFSPEDALIVIAED